MTDPTNPTPAVEKDSQKENEQLLEKMLEEHEEWLALKDKGFEGVEKQFCARKFLDRCRYPLSKFNPHFRNRDLRHATFDGCVVQDVDFSGSNLDHASFIGARARRAIFHGADCMAANFSRCDLTSAQFNNHTQLNWADLLSATGPFVTGCFGQHPAIAYASVAAIGCMLHPLDYWLEHGREIGHDNLYKKFEIKAYLAWLKLAKQVLEEMNVR